MSADFTRKPADVAPDAMPLLCTHTGWAGLRFAGPDAVAFLHAQLSSDVAALREGDGQPWSYNSPKGRVLANGVLWRAPGDADALVMLLAADLADTIRRRLAMFVLRSKVSIDDLSGRGAVFGLARDGAADAVRSAFGVAPMPSSAVTFAGDATAFAWPDGRIAIVAPTAHAAIAHAALARHASIVDGETWRLAAIRAGVPMIRTATSDRFVPQMLNLDVLGGVSFRKGCYPGQEIVARMQYLGRLKERLFAFRSDALEAAPGMRVFSPAFGADQACGTVIDAAPDPARGIALLAVAQIAAVPAGDLRLGSLDGPALAQVALPYEVPLEAQREARPA